MVDLVVHFSMSTGTLIPEAPAEGAFSPQVGDEVLLLRDDEDATTDHNGE